MPQLHSICAYKMVPLFSASGTTMYHMVVPCMVVPLGTQKVVVPLGMKMVPLFSAFGIFLMGR